MTLSLAFSILLPFHHCTAKQGHSFPVERAPEHDFAEVVRSQLDLDNAHQHRPFCLLAWTIQQRMGRIIQQIATVVTASRGFPSNFLEVTTEAPMPGHDIWNSSSPCGRLYHASISGISCLVQAPSVHSRASWPRLSA